MAQHDDPRFQFDDEQAKQHLASLISHFSDKTRDSGERRFAVVLALLRVARAVIAGDVLVDSAMSVVSKHWSEFVVFPGSKSHEFDALGEVVAHALSATVVESDGTPSEASVETRVATLAGFLTQKIAARFRVSPWLRELAQDDWVDRLPQVTEAIRGVLMAENEAHWVKKARDNVCRAALRALGVPESRFKNDEFEPRVDPEKST